MGSWKKSFFLTSLEPPGTKQKKSWTFELYWVGYGRQSDSCLFLLAHGWKSFSFSAALTRPSLLIRPPFLPLEPKGVGSFSVCNYNNRLTPTGLDFWNKRPPPSSRHKVPEWGGNQSERWRSQRIKIKQMHFWKKIQPLMNGIERLW